MDWGKVTYIFLTLMSLTTTAGFLYEPNIIALFIAGGVNVISTILKIGVKIFLFYSFYFLCYFIVLFTIHCC